MFKPKRPLSFVAVTALWLGMLLDASALNYNFVGLDKKDSTNWSPNSAWSSENLMDWKELDLIPVRVEVTGNAESDQVVVVFPHFNGSQYGFQNLYFISNSPNVSFTAPPMLTSALLGDWSYTRSLQKTNSTVGYVYFYARLAAGSRDYGG